MTSSKAIPVNEEITLAQLDRAPYPIYQRLRQENPVLHVKAVRRTLLTKADDTRFVKATPELFSTNDPSTPMKRAMWSHTLMRKDGQEHRRERMAMNGAFSPKVIANDWLPHYERIAREYVGRLPRGEIVDLFDALSGPYAARGLAILLGMEEATDEQMQEWSQSLIEGAGNFGWQEKLFERSDLANEQIHTLLDSITERHLAEPNNSALSLMLNADNPIPKKQMYANIKIAIGGGINEPRDAMNTIIYGLLTHPDQLEAVVQNHDWDKAFEEGIRWVAPIQVSSRVAKEDVEIRGYHIPKDEVVMTIQASANRDEELFEDGEVFNVYRKDTGPHQAFGIGPHLCQGNRVARNAVGKIMLPILFERFPAMRIPDLNEVVWKGFGFRGTTRLPVLLQ